jgi:HEAT repeat protein
MDAPEKDPSLQPSPNYGSLGPGADVQLNGAPAPAETAKKRIPVGRIVLIDAVAMLLGLVIAFRAQPVRAAWEQIATAFGMKQPDAASPVLSETEVKSIERMPPERQAAFWLDRAVHHHRDGLDQIAARVDEWRGKMSTTSQLTSAIDMGLNADDMQVRAATIEVQLAAYKVNKTSEAMDALVTQAESDASSRPWALWTIGLLGNRGVQPERAADVLINYLHDPNEDTRKWAVEGLGHLGTDAVIQPLLTTLHDDTSAAVRERAACNLAASGMLSREQRRTVVPKLLDYTSDETLDGPTRGWVFQALHDITQQSIPNNPAAWRTWYQSSQN